MLELQAAKVLRDAVVDLIAGKNTHRILRFFFDLDTSE